MAQIRLTELMKKKTLLSFELFPPKSEAPLRKLPETITHLCDLSPDYISCTYGAGGTNVGQNREVCRMIRDAGSVPVTHFTVVRNNRTEMKRQMDQYLRDGVDHILALRGDIPQGESSTCSDFRYASELVGYIRELYGDCFEIGVAGSPEGHVEAFSLEADVAFLKQKQDNGADYIVTQLCWDMEQFKRWLDLLDHSGVTLPVNAGVMPVLDIRSTINAALSRNGCVLERELSRLISKYWVFPNPFVPAQDSTDPDRERKLEDFRKAGIEYTIRQINEYRTLGVEGIHIYTLNRWKAVTQIIEGTGLRNV